MNTPKKVLMIDDSTTDLALVESWLTGEPFLLYTSNNGKDGLAESIKLQPDLILLDILMPIKNGYDTIRELKKTPQTQHIPVIFISTKNSTVDQAWGIRQGAEAYLSKPFNKNDLILMLKKVLNMP